MAITDPIVIPADVMLIPVADLPEDIRRRLQPGKGDWAITRLRARTTSRILDADSAALVEEFRSPRTISEAVIRFSRARGLDAEQILVEAYPILDRLLGTGFLVPHGSEEAREIAPILEAGDEIAGFRVLENVQTLEDTELYLATTRGEWAALKIERPVAAGRSGGAFDREAAILQHLAGSIAPHFLAEGELEGRRWLAVEWFPGVEAKTAAAGLRRAGDLAGLLGFGRAILEVYARLHAEGIVHGDVHPRNLLVDAERTVRLIDFGFSLWTGAPDGLPRPGRAGMGFYFEPEYARAVLAGERPPDASPAGEQHAVAALLYFLLTGAHPRDFLLGKEEMLRQIAQEPPLPFAERGAEPWPEVEAILARALEKDPTRRFTSMADLAAAFANVGPPPARHARPNGPSEAEILLTRTLDRLGLDGPLLREVLPRPRASVNFGAAGLAFALYRIALAREDAHLLSLADLWATRAERDMGEEGFYDQEELTPEIVGQVTPYHTASGVHVVRGLLAHVQGDPAGRRRAVEAFLAAAREPCRNPDLTLGRSGVLLAASMVLDTFEEEPPTGLTELGDEILAGLWKEIDTVPAIPDCFERPNLGIAHGWAGYLYASLRWCRSAGRHLPPQIGERLHELGDCARPWGRGLHWPWYTGDGRHAGTMPGWCNGSAGFVFLWTLAGRMLGEPAFQKLAEGAAWNAWEAPGGGGTLCCGLAGRAYALLHLHRHGGGPAWLARARDLADRAALAVERDTEAPDSLYKGRIGVAVLAADLASPEGAAMPFFEEEGWGQG